jgi:hypothetical protein
MAVVTAAITVDRLAPPVSASREPSEPSSPGQGGSWSREQPGSDDETNQATAGGSRQLSPALVLRPLRRPRMLRSDRGHQTGHGSDRPSDESVDRFAPRPTHSRHHPVRCGSASPQDRPPIRAPPTQLDVEQARAALLNTLATLLTLRRSCARRGTPSVSCSACRRAI